MNTNTEIAARHIYSSFDQYWKEIVMKNKKKDQMTKEAWTQMITRNHKSLFGEDMTQLELDQSWDRELYHRKDARAKLKDRHSLSVAFGEYMAKKYGTQNGNNLTNASDNLMPLVEVKTGSQ
jgi:hypothetical protein